MSDRVLSLLPYAYNFTNVYLKELNPVQSYRTKKLVVP